MANSKSDGKAAKTMDVVQPGKTAPPATSRPVIVTNRPILRQDPMMVSPDGMEKTNEPAAQTSVSRVGKTLTVLAPQQSKTAKAPSLTPLSAADQTNDAGSTAAPAVPETPAAIPQGRTPEEIAGKKAITVKTDEVKPADDASASPAPAPSEPVPSSPAEPAPSAAKPAEPPAAATQPQVAPAPASTPGVALSTEDDISTDTAAAGGSGDAATSDDQLAPNKTIDDAKKKAEAAETERMAEQEQIVASRRYYLPIQNVAARRGVTRWLVVLVLVLILAAVWFDIVLDAGILHIGNLQPLTHFFR